MSGIAAAVIGGVATVGSGVMGYMGAQKASKAQAQAAQQQAQIAADQMAMQKEMFQKQIELQEPFRQGGLAAQNRLLTYLGLPGGQAGAEFGLYGKPFGMTDFETDPGYAFRMSEGMKAIERSAAAKGSLMSGATLKGIQRFGQDLASQEYQNAYNRFYNTRNQMLNPLQAFMGQGQTATNQMMGAAGQAAQGMAGTYGQMGQAAANLGQARASGYVGGANALMGGIQGIGNIANQYAQNQMMMQMFNPVQTAAAPMIGPGTSGFY